MMSLMHLCRPTDSCAFPGSVTRACVCGITTRPDSSVTLESDTTSFVFVPVEGSDRVMFEVDLILE